MSLSTLNLSYAMMATSTKVKPSTFLPSVEGFCYSIFWQDWARPAVTSILGRAPELHLVLSLMRDPVFSFLHVDLLFKVEMKSCGEPRGQAKWLHVTHDPTSGQSLASIMDLLSSLDPSIVIGSEAAPAINAPANPIQALGGVRQVPTALPVFHTGPGLDRTWDLATMPTQVVASDISWFETADPPVLEARRVSHFVRHFPATSGTPRLPQTYTSTQRFHMLYGGQEVLDNATRPTLFKRFFKPHPSTRDFRSDFSALEAVMSGSLDNGKLAAAESAASFSRCLGSRGNRLIPGWESATQQRWLNLRQSYNVQNANRQYFQQCFRLAGRFMTAKIAENYMSSAQDGHPEVHDTATSVRIVHINAAPIFPASVVAGAQAAPPQNGEHAFWDPQAQNDLLLGRAQFVDAEGFSREEIAQYLAAIVPTNEDNLPRLRLREPLADDTETYLFHNQRYTYPNGVTTVFVHHGNSPLPNAADTAWIAANTNAFPNSAVLGTVIRTISMRHDLGTEFSRAWDAQLYRVGATMSNSVTTKGPEVDNYQVRNASGSLESYCPRDVTGFGYYDVFFTPVATDTFMEGVLALDSRSLVTNAMLSCYFLQNSINWASKASTLLARHWGVPPPQGNQFIRNHLDKWIRYYYSDNLNVWSTLLANTMGLQYGFSPSSYTRQCEDASLPYWWRNDIAPYINIHYHELWAMQVIPVFQVLPYYDPDGKTSHVSWPVGAPAPSDSLYSFSGKVKLAREGKVYPGLSWVGDGGAEYNAQFYTAQSFNGFYPYEQRGVFGARLQWWDAEHVHAFPRNPNPGAYTPMSPIHSSWASFIAPGSLNSFRMQRDSLVNWGVNPLNTAEAPFTDRVKLNWWQASMGEAGCSLMVNYVSPLIEHREIDTLANYSTVIWEAGNQFGGMTFANLYDEITKANDKFGSIRPPQAPFVRAATLPYDPASVRPDTRILARRETSAHGSSKQPDSDTFNRYQALATKREAQGRPERQSEPQAEVQYVGRYPHFQSDLPNFSEYQAQNDPVSGTHLLPADPRLEEGPYSPGGLTRIKEELLARVNADADKAFDDYIRGAHRRYQQAPPTAVNAPHSSSPVPNPFKSSSRRHPTLSPHSPRQDKVVIGDFKESAAELREPVIPNDQPAVIAQHNLAIAQDAIDRATLERYAPGEKIAGARRASPPPRRHSPQPRDPHPRVTFAADTPRSLDAHEPLPDSSATDFSALRDKLARMDPKDIPGFVDVREANPDPATGSRVNDVVSAFATKALDMERQSTSSLTKN
ncbi:putative structural/gag protein [Rugonectria rugulosa dsRNA virus 1]|nr:putative structural/gag protein [Rugonectria rugulosa dsRNA virus 1]